MPWWARRAGGGCPRLPGASRLVARSDEVQLVPAFQVAGGDDVVTPHRGLEDRSGHVRIAQRPHPRQAADDASARCVHHLGRRVDERAERGADAGDRGVRGAVVAAAGVSFSLSEKEICRLVADAGFMPRQRLMDYTIIN